MTVGDRDAGAPPRAWRWWLPATLVVLLAAGGVVAVLVTGGSGSSSGAARSQIAGSVATTAATTRNVTATIQLTGSVAATAATTVVSAMTGRVDAVDVTLGRYVHAGDAIAHVVSLTASAQPAAYRVEPASPAPSSGGACPPSAGPSATPSPTVEHSRTPSASPSPTRPTVPVPSLAPRPTQSPRAGLGGLPGVLSGLPTAPTSMTLTAPFDGQVTQLTVVVGSTVTTGTTVAEVSGSGLEVHAAASPVQIQDIGASLGAAATVALAVPGTPGPLSARLASIAPTANPTSQQTSVVLAFTSGTGTMKAGDPVTAAVDIPRGQGVVVPADAVVYPDGVPAVYQVINAIDPTKLGVSLPANLPPGLLVGMVKLTTVRLGVHSGDEQQVTQGIGAGALVVTQGQTNLVDGVRVAILNSAGPSASPSPSAAGN